MQATFDSLCARLGESGLRVLHSGPPLPTWPPTPGASVLLVGQAGPEVWPHFSRSAEYADGQPDPLDRWSERVIRAAAPDMTFYAPSGGPPYAPIHALAAGGAFHPSPLGMLAHVEFGLWTAFRGILISPEPVPASKPHPAPDPKVYAPCLLYTSPSPRD